MDLSALTVVNYAFLDLCFEGLAFKFAAPDH
jgi:hypothetical protein